MKLNKKGYMLVEIIVSFVLACSIAIYLLNLTIKFKDTNEDIYYSSRYLKDKNLIIKNIMTDLEKGTITKVKIDPEFNNVLDFMLVIFNGSNEIIVENRRLVIDEHTITYGKYDSSFIVDDVSYYSKEIDSSLMVGNLENCSNLYSGYFCVKIPITSIYNDDNYDIKLFSDDAKFNIEIPAG